MDTKDKSKKMSNEGHGAKVPHGGTIGTVFLIGLVVGCIVVFLAVAGRTEGVIQQRRQMQIEKNAKAAAAAGPLSPSPAESVDAPVGSAPETPLPPTSPVESVPLPSTDAPAP